MCAVAHPLDLLFLRAVQQCFGVVADRGDDEIAQVLEQVFDESTRVLTGLDNAFDRRECGGCVAGGNRLGHLVEQLGVCEAEQ